MAKITVVSPEGKKLSGVNVTTTGTTGRMTGTEQEGHTDHSGSCVLRECANRCYIEVNGRKAQTLNGDTFAGPIHGEIQLKVDRWN